jgi:hypothetical protein
MHIGLCVGSLALLFRTLQETSMFIISTKASPLSIAFPWWPKTAWTP